MTKPLDIHKGVKVTFIEGEPPTDTPRSVYSKIRATLRANPGKWAQLHVFSKAQMETARNVAVALAHKQGDIEAVRRVVDDQVIVYARAKETNA